MRFSKILVSVIVGNAFAFAWFWSIVFVLKGIEPPSILTTCLYSFAGGELALTLAASSIGDRYDLTRVKTTTGKTTTKKDVTLTGNA